MQAQVHRVHTQGPCPKAAAPAVVCLARGLLGGAHLVPHHTLHTTSSRVQSLSSVLRLDTGALPRQPMKEAGSALATVGGHMFAHKRHRALRTLGLQNQTTQLVTACVPVCQPRSPSHCRIPLNLCCSCHKTPRTPSSPPHTRLTHLPVTFARLICLTTPMIMCNHVQPCVAQGLHGPLPWRHLPPPACCPATTHPSHPPHIMYSQAWHIDRRHHMDRCNNGVPARPHNPHLNTSITHTIVDKLYPYHPAYTSR